LGRIEDFIDAPFEIGEEPTSSPNDSDLIQNRKEEESGEANDRD
jgi:hypothetical protein